MAALRQCLDILTPKEALGSLPEEARVVPPPTATAAEREASLAKAKKHMPPACAAVSPLLVASLVAACRR